MGEYRLNVSSFDPKANHLRGASTFPLSFFPQEQTRQRTMIPGQIIDIDSALLGEYAENEVRKD